MCPIWFLNVSVKLPPFIMLNVETKSTKMNILSLQLLMFPCVSTGYLLVYNNRVANIQRKIPCLIIWFNNEKKKKSVCAIKNQETK